MLQIPSKHVQTALKICIVNRILQWRSCIPHRTCLHPLHTVLGRVLSILDGEHTSLHRTNERTFPGKAHAIGAQMVTEHIETAVLLSQ